MTAANTVNKEAFPSLDSKGSTSISLEEERDLYRQRLMSMKIVMKDVQEQLTRMKMRCAGVDTVALMLKESKQELRQLTRQNKALETAVANLQNRLSTNGLSSSVNIEETELFVPGASKQTLDNLARENARLRGLLKTTEAQGGKKGTEDAHSWKASAENLECENSQLKSQLLEMEGTKMNMVKQYEDLIKKLKEEYDSEKKHHDLHSEEKTDMNKKSTGCQTENVEPSKIEQIREALQSVSTLCLQLDLDLENSQLAAKREERNDGAEKEGQSAAEKELLHLEQERKIQQVVLMNQRWQTYCEQQTADIRSLQARLADLEGVAQESGRFQASMEAAVAENQRLKQEIENLRRESHQRQPQHQFDSSIVEILKQQIQVCTEDFNTERKDREQAVNRAKQLQEEVKRLRTEKDLLKNENDSLKKIKNSPQSQLENREEQSWEQTQVPAPQFKTRGPQLYGVRVPFDTYSQGIRRPLSYTSASSSASMSRGSGSEGNLSLSPRASSSYPYSQSSNDNISGYGTLPRSKRNSTPEYLPHSSSPLPGNLSMPALNRNNSSTRDDSEQQKLICPKCSREFSDSDLLKHIDLCPA